MKVFTLTVVSVAVEREHAVANALQVLASIVARNNEATSFSVGGTNGSADAHLVQKEEEPCS